jgi:ketosteroid isomerase-like protein
MSQENVEIVRSLCEAFNRRDWEAASLGLHPDVELTTPPGLNAGTYRGREEWRGYFTEIRTQFEDMTIEVEQVFESGDQVVVALTKTRVRPKRTDAEFEIRNGQIWTIRQGKVVSMRIFPEPEKALQAAGLRE